MSETKPLVGGDEADNLRKLRAYQPWAFFITFGGYMMAHFSRKSYSTIKGELERSAGYSPLLLSAMDTVFMATYAVGNVVNGKLGDTFNPTTILALGLFGSGICLFAINALVWFDTENYSAQLGNVLILIFYFVFGFAQATGGPVGTAVMGNWFCDAKSEKNRGIIFGLWTCHQYVGDVAAQLASAAIFAVGWPYWWCLTIPALANVLWAFVTMQLVADPVDKDIITPEVRIRQQKNAEKAERGEEQDDGPKPIGFVEAFQIPMVAQYAIAFGFFKLCNYAFFFWLPYFLENTFTSSQANLIASAYSFGMMPGGIIVGVVSDAFGGRRAVVIGVFMVILMGFLAIFAVYSEVLSANAFAVMLFCMGTLVGGPNNIITSAVAADLASHPSVRGSAKSLGTVTGLINGTGSIVSSVGLLAIGPLQAAFGWSSVWIFMIGSTFIGTCLMSTKIYAELRGQ
mmetsp:Transcript_20591/g.30519  ORF Transcript_20591/g.30519 Transcript_20591/m.30519 type:complete len:457 (+) Transcript_20591:105-1475(+)|eukprot:CAMPEP_0194200172 /NCGR_PEP_ID=MMETSP0156-20130528/896_1 /TAXON_ID=33649 /ORGANISM="Thalassionema nitzschioides, Strain L26-B" /LENGTH=456 /DNA_ID=CAMNT_0038925139 /DNA_START=54 /DNA_END=1424 /DNA_ORIENTATION=-